MFKLTVHKLYEKINKIRSGEEPLSEEFDRLRLVMSEYVTIYCEGVVVSFPVKTTWVEFQERVKHFKDRSDIWVYGDAVAAAIKGFRSETIDYAIIGDGAPVEGFQFCRVEKHISEALVNVDMIPAMVAYHPATGTVWKSGLARLCELYEINPLVLGSENGLDYFYKITTYCLWKYRPILPDYREKPTLVSFTNRFGVGVRSDEDSSRQIILTIPAANPVSLKDFFGT